MGEDQEIRAPAPCNLLPREASLSVSKLNCQGCLFGSSPMRLHPGVFWSSHDLLSHLYFSSKFSKSQTSCVCAPKPSPVPSSQAWDFSESCLLTLFLKAWVWRPVSRPAAEVCLSKSDLVLSVHGFLLSLPGASQATNRENIQKAISRLDEDLATLSQMSKLSESLGFPHQVCALS